MIWRQSAAADVRGQAGLQWPPQLQLGHPEQCLHGNARVRRDRRKDTTDGKSAPENMWRNHITRMGGQSIGQRWRLTRAMHLQPKHMNRQHASHTQRAQQHPLLSWTVGCRQAAASTVLVDEGTSEQHANNWGVVGACQVQHGACFAANIAIRCSVECFAASIDRQHAWQRVEGVVAIGVAGAWDKQCPVQRQAPARLAAFAGQCMGQAVPPADWDHSPAAWAALVVCGASIRLMPADSASPAQPSRCCTAMRVPTIADEQAVSMLTAGPEKPYT